MGGESNNLIQQKLESVCYTLKENDIRNSNKITLKKKDSNVVEDENICKMLLVH